MKTVSVKIGKMRKADECVVYPENRDGKLFIQGKRLVALVCPETGRAIINHNTGSSYPTSWHLVGIHPNTYAVIIEQSLLQQIKACQPKSGDHIGGGVYIA
jgi:hypothetical protein